MHVTFSISCLVWYDSLDQAAQYSVEGVKDSDSGSIASTMESVLSLDDGRWSRPVEEASPALINEAREDPFQFVGIRQPSPPPVLAQVHDFSPIPPSKVADPRPGPAKSSQDVIPSSNSYQHLHVVGVTCCFPWFFKNIYMCVCVCACVC